MLNDANLDSSIAGRLHILGRLLTERTSFIGSAKLARAIPFDHRGRP